MNEEYIIIDRKIIRSLIDLFWYFGINVSAVLCVSKYLCFYIRNFDLRHSPLASFPPAMDDFDGHFLDSQTQIFPFQYMIRLRLRVFFANTNQTHTVLLGFLCQQKPCLVYLMHSIHVSHALHSPDYNLVSMSTSWSIYIASPHPASISAARQWKL